MLGRTSGAKAKVSQAAETVAGYVDPLVKDEKLRQRLLDALAVGVAARQRARRQSGGVASLARRLGSDPVLRDQLAELATHLRGAKDQVRSQLPTKQAKKHRLRNTTLLIAGAGLVVASSPTLREKIVAKAKAIFFGEGDDDSPSGGPDSTATPTKTDESVDGSTPT